MKFILQHVKRGAFSEKEREREKNIGVVGKKLCLNNLKKWCMLKLLDSLCMVPLMHGSVL